MTATTENTEKTGTEEFDSCQNCGEENVKLSPEGYCQPCLAERDLGCPSDPENFPRELDENGDEADRPENLFEKFLAM